MKENFSFKISKPINNNEWKDSFYGLDNNLYNFFYNENNQVIFKSKKLSNKNINKYLLYKDNKLILNDSKGNIIVFSIDNNEIISKFNFYKKKYKKIKKNLNLIIDKNIIYVSDNLGYLYAYNFELDKIIWAKSYKTPFRSNIKILQNKIIASNEKNDFLIFNKINKKIIKMIPTEETIINNSINNTISLNRSKETLLFLNSYGTLYSIDSNLLNINWFINLSTSTDLAPNNLFLELKL